MWGGHSLGQNSIPSPRRGGPEPAAREKGLTRAEQRKPKFKNTLPTAGEGGKGQGWGELPGSGGGDCSEGGGGVRGHGNVWGRRGYGMWGALVSPSRAPGPSAPCLYPPEKHWKTGLCGGQEPKSPTPVSGLYPSGGCGLPLPDSPTPPLPTLLSLQTYPPLHKFGSNLRTALPPPTNHR